MNHSEALPALRPAARRVTGRCAARRLHQARVAVEAGERFGAGGAGHIRVNFATSEEILSPAIDRTAAALR